MNAILLIAKRDLRTYLRTWTGYIILALVLAIDGLIFNTGLVMGNEVGKRSAEVLSSFFWVTSGLSIIATVLLTLRLLAEEHQQGTINLLYSSPVSDAQIVLGKYLSSLVFIAIMLATTAFMPLLILVHGKISFAHLLTGYLGAFLACATTLALGTFASALTRSPIVAVVIAAVITAALVVCWYVARVTERPISSIFENLALWNLHLPPFQVGIIHLRDVVYFFAVTYVALFAATRVVEARRWR